MNPPDLSSEPCHPDLLFMVVYARVTFPLPESRLLMLGELSHHVIMILKQLPRRNGSVLLMVSTRT